MANKRNSTFEYLCTLSQKTMKKKLFETLRDLYKDITVADGFIFAKGELPILLVAHMDTVHSEVPRKFVYQGSRVSSPQGIGGDDRCGIYAILNIILERKCSVLFCEDEESGGIGAKKFVKHKASDGLEFNYIIELDRMGEKDAVFYDCDNEEFEKFITEDGDWKTAYGSYSDICTVAPALKCAAVNLSCGYYSAHTKKEYVNLKELENCIKKVIRLIDRTTEDDKFEYIECKSRYYSGYYGGYYGGGWYDDYDDFGYEPSSKSWIIYFEDGNDFENFEEVIASSRYEAIGKFLVMYPTLTYDNIWDIEQLERMSFY